MQMALLYKSRIALRPRAKIDPQHDRNHNMHKEIRL